MFRKLLFLALIVQITSCGSEDSKSKDISPKSTSIEEETPGVLAPPKNPLKQLPPQRRPEIPKTKAPESEEPESEESEAEDSETEVQPDPESNPPVDDEPEAENDQQAKVAPDAEPDLLVNPAVAVLGPKSQPAVLVASPKKPLSRVAQQKADIQEAERKAKKELEKAREKQPIKGDSAKVKQIKSAIVGGVRSGKAGLSGAAIKTSIFRHDSTWQKSSRRDEDQANAQWRERGVLTALNATDRAKAVDTVIEDAKKWNAKPALADAMLTQNFIWSNIFNNKEVYNRLADELEPVVFERLAEGSVRTPTAWDAPDSFARIVDGMKIDGSSETFLKKISAALPAVARNSKVSEAIEKKLDAFRYYNKKNPDVLQEIEKTKSKLKKAIAERIAKHENSIETIQSGYSNRISNLSPDELSDILEQSVALKDNLDSLTASSWFWNALYSVPALGVELSDVCLSIMFNWASDNYGYKDQNLGTTNNTFVRIINNIATELVDVEENPIRLFKDKFRAIVNGVESNIHKDLGTILSGKLEIYNGSFDIVDGEEPLDQLGEINEKYRSDHANFIVNKFKNINKSYLDYMDSMYFYEVYKIKLKNAREKRLKNLDAYKEMDNERVQASKRDAEQAIALKLPTGAELVPTDKKKENFRAFMQNGTFFVHNDAQFRDKFDAFDTQTVATLLNELQDKEGLERLASIIKVMPTGKILTGAPTGFDTIKNRKDKILVMFSSLSDNQFKILLNSYQIWELASIMPEAAALGLKPEHLQGMVAKIRDSGLISARGKDAYDPERILVSIAEATSSQYPQRMYDALYALKKSAHKNKAGYLLGAVSKKQNQLSGALLQLFKTNKAKVKQMIQELSDLRFSAEK